MSYTEFNKIFGNGERVKDLPTDDLQVIREQISPSLADFFSQEGACRYDHGFLFTVNPMDYRDIVELIAGDDSKGWAIARTCFGDLYLVMDDKVYLYQSSFNKFLEVAKDVESFFSVFLVHTDFADKFLFRDIYPEAHERLGDAGYNECYGFVPAIPLGGPESVNNLQMVTIKAYLSIIIQAQQ
ncbi:MAG TPA: T6SS immunity protein Tdi1 domain-containing protein [Puia sp.]|jgi:hypothetical protein|nr:T6SS immunity protein Tdi1 domain-containing protein [Puia sp.]